MKKIIALFTIVMSTALFATNTISVVSDTVANGTPQITVDFLLENTDDVGGFQLDLIGDPDVLTGTGVSTEFDGMTIAGGVQGDGSYRLICYSMSDAFYPAGFNDIAFSVTFDVNSNMTEEPVFIDIVAGSLVIADQFGDALDGDFVGGDFYFSGDAPAPIISVDPGELTFTPTVLGESVTEILTISNVGTADLTVVAICADDAALFETDFGTPFTLAPDATHDLSVTYNTPADDFGFGTMSNLHIINDSGVADKQVPMQVLSVPDLTVEPTSLDFGTVEAWTDSTLSFVITNTGTEDLTVRIVASDVDPVTAFAWTPEMTSYTTLLMGESETIEVTISEDALASGNYTGTLEIWRANLGWVDEVLDETVSLSVEYIAPPPPDISVNPLSLSSELFTGDIDSSQVITITNDGESDLVWELEIEESDTSYFKTLRELANSAVSGITQSGSRTIDDKVYPAFTGSELERFKQQYSEYKEDIQTLQRTRDFPIIGVGGCDYGDMFFILLSNEELISAYAFVEVYDYGSDDLSGIDALIIAECDYEMYEYRAQALYDFYESGRPIFLGMDDLDGNWYEVSTLLGPVFGISSPTDGDFCDEGADLLNYAHPINEGIEYFYNDGGWCNDNDYFYLDGADWLFMDYSDRYFGVANDGNARTVIMGEMLSDIWYANEQLNVNAVNWMMESVSWLSVSEESGIIPAGSSQDIQVTFDATNLLGGEYLADIIVSSNDPDESEVIVDATLTVTGVPSIIVDSDSLDFGEVFVTGHKEIDLVIYSVGTDDLIVDDISSDNPDFYAEPSSFTILPNEEQVIQVSFAPSSDGFQEGVLTISNNDSTVQIYVSGTGLLPPDISVVPDSLTASLDVDSSATRQITISNEGVSNLEWNLVMQTEEDASNVIMPLALGNRWEFAYHDSVEYSDDDFLTWDIQEIINYAGSDWYVFDHSYEDEDWRPSLPLPNFTEPEVRDSTERWTGWRIAENGDLYLGNYYHYEYGYEDFGETKFMIGNPYLGASWFFFEIVGQEDVVTDAGVFTDCWKVRMMDDFREQISFYWKFGVGLVKWGGYNNGEEEVVNLTDYFIQPSWLTPDISSGILVAGEEEVVNLTFDATDLVGGDYEATILLTSNDPDESEINIPVSMYVEGPIFPPQIVSIVDVSEDQGGFVYLNFTRSSYDTDTPSRSEMYTIERLDNEIWTGVLSLVAYGQDNYQAYVPTLIDSSNTSDGLTQFRVIASMDEGIWLSDVASGYSVDNIVPTQPSGLLANTMDSMLNLNWDNPVDEDFAYFTIYKDEQIAEYTTEPEFATTLEISSADIYAVSSTDANGNESDKIMVGAQNIPKSIGWNMFSSFALPDNSDMLDIFSPLIESGTLVKVIAEDGSAILNFMGNWINGIGDLELTEGYYVKLNESVDFSLAGAPSVLPFEIPFQIGWNIMGYPADTAHDALYTIQSLIDAGVLEKVLAADGSAIIFFFGSWINNIGNFETGEGYYVKMNDDYTFILDEIEYTKPSIAIQPYLPEIGEHFVPSYIGNPFQPMSLFVTEITVDDKEIEIGDEIGLFDGAICVGSSKITKEIEPGRFWVTASKDDGSGNGFGENHPIAVKIYDVSENKEYDTIKITWVDSENEPTDKPFFEGLGTAFAELNAINIPDEFCLSQNYPNPFNPVTTIQFGLPKDSEVDLVIYDLLGREVANLVNTNLEAGYHEIQWNGQNALGQPVSSGVYFYRLSTPEFQNVKKMVVLQ